MSKKIVVLTLAVACLLALPLLAYAEEAPAAAPAVEAGASTAPPPPPKPPKPLDVGDTLPPSGMELKALEGGGIVNLAKLPKKAIVVFMNTACSACQQEMSSLFRLYLSKKGEVDFLAISVDINGEKTMPGFAASNPYKPKYLLDPEFKTPPRFGFSFTPATLVIDTDGKVLFKMGGWLKSAEKEIMQEISNVL